MHTAPDRGAEPSALLRATETLLDDLAEKREQEYRLARQLRGTRMRIESLMIPLRAALGALPEGEREGPRARLARIEAQYGDTTRRLGTTPASEALLGYLANRDAGVVTVGEVQAWLEQAGHAPRRRYAALALARLQRLGIVTRQRYGAYAIHRFHPELAARRAQAGPEGP